ncbi:hypothetical protein tb265_37310 [Gemmatimonadetes bacterium T265]|nr:hypothetical protein tb265_37310 [Gemmatimonadetes bacterium T265]
MSFAGKSDPDFEKGQRIRSASVRNEDRAAPGAGSRGGDGAGKARRAGAVGAEAGASAAAPRR